MPDENHNDLKIGELPVLRIVHLDDVVFHEDPDIERVADLVDRFGADGVLRNPPVVGVRDGSAKRVLLDGANRVTALRKLDYTHVLVQEIDYADPGLVLDRWHHAVEKIAPARLLAHATSIDGVSLRTEDTCPLSAPEFLSRLRFADGDTKVLSGGGSLIGKVGQLREFTHLYQHLATMDRVSYTNLEHLRRNYRDFSALVTFPRFTKEDLVAVSERNVLLPSGITRVLLPKRALRFNLRLDILRSRLSTDEKNLWLQDAIRQRILDKGIRFYREPTFSFDE